MVVVGIKWDDSCKSLRERLPVRNHSVNILYSRTLFWCVFNQVSIEMAIRIPVSLKVSAYRVDSVISKQRECFHLYSFIYFFKILSSSSSQTVSSQDPLTFENF